MLLLNIIKHINSLQNSKLAFSRCTELT